MDFAEQSTNPDVWWFRLITKVPKVRRILFLEQLCSNSRCVGDLHCSAGIASPSECTTDMNACWWSDRMLSESSIDVSGVPDNANCSHPKPWHLNSPLLTRRLHGFIELSPYFHIRPIQLEPSLVRPSNVFTVINSPMGPGEPCAEHERAFGSETHINDGPLSSLHADTCWYASV